MNKYTLSPTQVQWLRRSWLWIFSLLLPLTVHAQEGQPSVVIDSCVVYSRQHSELRSDCTEVAREFCGEAPACELPIGLGLTGGKDIDGDANTWELVKVDYNCNGLKRVNGPHDQNDHATMSLFCGH